MLCTACGTAFTPKRQQEGRRFCSNKCRATYWRRRKARVQHERDRKIRDLLQEALEVLSEGDQL